MSGTFVTLEGIDGAGKTSAADALEAHYGEDMVRTQEPSEEWTGPNVRKALSATSEEAFYYPTNPMTTFHLFMADRALHIEQLIKPALEEGKLVVSDRYSDSTRAYQSHALRPYTGSFTGQYIDRVMAPWDVEPDLTVLMDISVDTALERCSGEDEYENRDFLERVHSNYQDLAVRFRDRYVVVDAERPQEEVLRDVVRVIEEAR